MMCGQKHFYGALFSLQLMTFSVCVSLPANEYRWYMKEDNYDGIRTSIFDKNWHNLVVTTINHDVFMNMKLHDFATLFYFHATCIVSVIFCSAFALSHYDNFQNFVLKLVTAVCFLYCPLRFEPATNQKLFIFPLMYSTLRLCTFLCGFFERLTRFDSNKKSHFFAIPTNRIFMTLRISILRQIPTNFHHFLFMVVLMCHSIKIDFMRSIVRML